MSRNAWANHLRSIRPRPAFTLIEALVACVIGAFIAMTSVGAMQMMINGRQRLENYTESADQLRFACDTIRDDLLRLYRDPQNQNIKFEASMLADEQSGIEQVSLTFYTISRSKARIGYPEGDVYEVQYMLKANSETGKTALLRRLCPTLPGVAADDPDKEMPQGIVYTLIDDVREFSVTFFDGEDWLNEWGEETTGLPDLVSVDIVSMSLSGKREISRSFVVNFPRMPKGDGMDMTGDESAGEMEDESVSDDEPQPQEEM